jgi:hypothetical protein
MLERSEPVTDLLTQFRGVKGLPDLEVSRQIATRLPVGAIASIDVLSARTGLTKVQTYTRIVEAGLRSFRQSLEPDELADFNAESDAALAAMLKEGDEC